MSSGDRDGTVNKSLVCPCGATIHYVAPMPASGVRCPECRNVVREATAGDTPREGSYAIVIACTSILFIVPILIAVVSGLITPLDVPVASSATSTSTELPPESASSPHIPASPAATKKQVREEIQHQSSTPDEKTRANELQAENERLKEELLQLKKAKVEFHDSAEQQAASRQSQNVPPNEPIAESLPISSAETPSEVTRTSTAQTSQLQSSLDDAGLVDEPHEDETTNAKAIRLTTLLTARPDVVHDESKYDKWLDECRSILQSLEPQDIRPVTACLIAHKEYLWLATVTSDYLDSCTAELASMIPRIEQAFDTYSIGAYDSFHQKLDRQYLLITLARLDAARFRSKAIEELFVLANAHPESTIAKELIRDLKVTPSEQATQEAALAKLSPKKDGGLLDEARQGVVLPERTPEYEAALALSKEAEVELATFLLSLSPREARELTAASTALAFIRQCWKQDILNNATTVTELRKILTYPKVMQNIQRIRLYAGPIVVVRDDGQWITTDEIIDEAVRAVIGK